MVPYMTERRKMRFVGIPGNGFLNNGLDDLQCRKYMLIRHFGAYSDIQGRFRVFSAITAIRIVFSLRFNFGPRVFRYLGE